LKLQKYLGEEFVPSQEAKLGILALLILEEFHDGEYVFKQVRNISS